MPLVTSPSSVRSSAPSHSIPAREPHWLRTWVVALVLSSAAAAAGFAAEQSGADFGKDIQLAPSVVKGKSLAVSIHARTKSDRRYAERFADEVVQVAYETLNDSTGRGLVIVGTKGEPHPIHFFRKFLEMARAGQLDPGVAAAAPEVEAMLTKAQKIFKIDQGPGDQTGITFDTLVPALPLPLEGAASRLYQLAWAEGFEAARVEKMLQSLTQPELARNDLTRYDWVFYLPPHSATSGVLDEMLTKAMAAEKMGMVKRAAVRTAVFAFSPFIRKAVEAMRKGMLFRTILDEESPYDDGDLEALTKVYIRELMPDLKPGSGDERRRALAAIEKQKVENAEYAKDPFVKPERLATWDPAAYARFEGDYSSEPPQATHSFKREGDSFQWRYKQSKPRVFHPAGDSLLVSEDGSMTIRFIVGDDGTVTGVEERRVRRRQVVPRLPPQGKDVPKPAAI